jgi:hypothetical protein
MPAAEWGIALLTSHFTAAFSETIGRLMCWQIKSE